MNAKMLSLQTSSVRPRWAAHVRDSAGGATPDFSLATETMDNDMFTRYLSDSSF